MPPPPYYVKQTRTAAWLRLGKIAIFSILAGLAIAVGMALPDGKAAEAQGIHNGYTYTRMVCQEYGQQPRWHNVRNPIPGSDWRNDGGWAIILERGGFTSTTTFSSGGNPERTMQQYNGSGYTAGAPLVDNSGGDWDGYQGLIVLGSVLYANRLVVLDANRDGAITAADEVYGSGNNRLYLLFFDIEQSGGSYIRWANMQWCR